MIGPEKLYQKLAELSIPFDYYEHPEAPTVEIALQYWKDVEAQHCKNLFFRNHKGNQHYLIVLDCHQALNIKDIEQRLKQGKISFASPERMQKYLGVTPGSVTPLALINDAEHHVKVFLDKNLRHAERISFHPCKNTASLVIKFSDFERFMDDTGNNYEYIELY